ncbi:DUF817 domain-containing protein [Thorsellia anophelis]|uniref:Uncharacterized membrane protein YoaT, DUF817 family n=1 Tax=Thorsellia anophelis DSM 18579 TaxID=1123402 RepID=A0A1I0DY36_9GAMM|nr:DUF817 domain-containing protein [Thorsellia anophelis]SET36942.1 Uncharacterized membrane protein YoaT, DUF817 family [Thorsellia anophelis DSM 18579]
MYTILKNFQTRLIRFENTHTQRILNKPRIIRAGYEFLRFGILQAWICLFGGIMCALLIATHYFYPVESSLHRYDFLTVCALIIQIMLIWSKLETWDEAKIIFIFHIVGTVMEIYKTYHGSWIYPHPAFLKIGGVPLFTGFMYAAVGSYIFRAWKVMDFQFSYHPPKWAYALLSLAIYVNFFTNHYFYDVRYLLFAASVLLIGRSWIYYKIWIKYRRMPMLLAGFLTAFFIYIAENIGTYSQAWAYPNQIDGWKWVSLGKLGSWYLLIILSYCLTLIVKDIKIFEIQRR